MHLNFVKGNGNNVSDAEISFGTIFKHFLECLVIISLIVLLCFLDAMSSKVLLYAFVQAVNLCWLFYLFVWWPDHWTKKKDMNSGLFYYGFITLSHQLQRDKSVLSFFKRLMWPLISLEFMLHTISALLHIHYRTKALWIWSKSNKFFLLILPKTLVCLLFLLPVCLPFLPGNFNVTLFCYNPFSIFSDLAGRHSNSV